MKKPIDWSIAREPMSPPKVNTGFLQCSRCRKTLFLAEYEANLWVCPSCGHHSRLSAGKRISIAFDPGSFEEVDADLVSLDPLGFPEYASKLSDSVAKTGLNDCFVTGWASIGGFRVSAGVSDFFFMGGSMGSVAGEKVARLFDRAVEARVPAVIYAASGGGRMQEGLLSLLQLGKTTAAIQDARDQGIPFLCVHTDPTMAGVLASYASIADVILAEPGCTIGFAGLRVSKQAQVVRVPDDFQTAEFGLRNGFVDRVVPRRELKQTLTRLIDTLGAHLRG